MKDTPHTGKSRVIEFLDSFKVRGVNGEHTCMVFEVSPKVVNVLKIKKSPKNNAFFVLTKHSRYLAARYSS